MVVLLVPPESVSEVQPAKSMKAMGPGAWELARTAMWMGSVLASQWRVKSQRSAVWPSALTGCRTGTTGEPEDAATHEEGNRHADREHLVGATGDEVRKGAHAAGDSQEDEDRDDVTHEALGPLLVVREHLDRALARGEENAMHEHKFPRYQADECQRQEDDQGREGHPQSAGSRS